MRDGRIQYGRRTKKNEKNEKTNRNEITDEKRRNKKIKKGKTKYELGKTRILYWGVCACVHGYKQNKLFCEKCEFCMVSNVFFK